MKKLMYAIICFSMFTTASQADCNELLSKYKNVPDPSVKTMKQLQRWVKRKVKDDNAKAVEECLVSQAADNPNKATVAGQ
jgi:hypothetical protein